MPVPRIYATSDIGPAALDRLRVRGWELEIYPGPEPPPHGLVVAKVASGVDALVTTLRDTVDEAVFAAGARARLRVVAQMAVGVDNIDRAAANRHRIPFSHTPDVLTDATAEFAFFILGAVARKTWPSEHWVRSGQWTGWHPSLPFLGDEVSGKTLAVIGTGRIGKALINKAVGFDLDVVAHDPKGEDRDFATAIRAVMRVRHATGLCRRAQTLAWVPLDEALARADFVSLHVPLVAAQPGRDSTYHLIDERRLGLMKPTAYLVNTARGPLVDEVALARALGAGRIAGAALDVFEQEPLPAESPLRDPALADRVRLFHHFASGGRATRLSPDPDIGMAGRAVEVVIDVLAGDHGGDLGRVPFIVNREAFEE
ncbi:MAG: D-glycerate dehydrogenase [Myxococcales bacterium]|nr:D-glycerate dehydrogenase [Myxococcales bacterium]